MRKIIFILSVSIASLSIFGCKTQNQGDLGEVINVEISKSTDVFDFAPLLDTTFRIIPLETSGECLIGEISKFEILGDKFYILDQLTKSVYIFDKNGKYLSKIFSVGQGPGEYVEATYMAVTDNSIVIIDLFSLKQLEYSLTGEFISEERILEKIWCNDLFWFNNKMYYINDGSETDSGNFYLFSRSKGADFEKYLPFQKAPIGMGTNGPNYGMISQNVSLIYSGSDNIYEVNSKGDVTLKYRVQFDREKVKYKEDDIAGFSSYNADGLVVGINKIQESDEFLFFYISMTGNTDYQVVYNKESKDTKVYDVGICSHFNRAVITNNVRGRNMINLFNAQTFITLYSDTKLTESRHDKQIKEILARITPEDNPVIFIYDLK